MQYQEESDAHTKEYAERLDAQDPLRQLRKEFIIPTKSDLKRKTLTKASVCFIMFPSNAIQLTTYTDYMYRMMTSPESRASIFAAIL